jgi:predicted NAD-dependent protein-ADP-ribosyltransferase YbiA (DUF1768 family)
MELHAAEAKQLAALIHEWFIHPDYELESTFGVGGRIDSVTFTNIAQRLFAKGYRGLPQEDRMTVMTPEHVRFTLPSIGVITQYCLDDTMATKPYVAVIKDRAMAEGNVDLDDYTTRIKLRREIPMGKADPKLKELLASWQQQRKAFRMIRRWSFEAEGLHFDLSIVRSTPQDAKGEYRWQRKFRDQDIAKQAPVYEVEVELARIPGDTEEAALKRLIKGVGEILRGVQKHTLLLRNSQRKKIMNNYTALTKTEVFRGPPPFTLERKNFGEEREVGEANIRDGYNVTDKADGLRCLGFVDGTGELFLIDMGLNIYRTSLVQPNCRLSLVDGEWITRNASNEPIQQYLIFDIFNTTDRKDVSQLPFKAEKDADCRHTQMEKWIGLWNDRGGPSSYIPSLPPKSWIQVSMKTFKIAKPGDLEIFQAAGAVLDAAKNYHTDGLIFTPNGLPLPTQPGAPFREQLKWKPAKDNTIDFLVKMEKSGERKTADLVTTEVKSETGETVSYKTLRLYVGSSANLAHRNSRDYILNKRGDESDQKGLKGRKEKYRAVPFSPLEYPDTMAAICHLETETDYSTGEVFVKTKGSDEPINDESIVEMAYDPAAAPGWRWQPLRVRMDKTERFQRGILSRTLNGDATAESVWNSIHNPITEAMIRSGRLGSASVTAEPVAKPYFERKGQIQNIDKVSASREFHNRYIKEKVLLRVGLRGGGRSILDLSVGKGADLQKWIRAGAAFCFGVDLNPDCITNKNDGAYRRVINVMGNSRRGIPPTIFCIGDSTKPIVTGEAGANDEEKDILRAVFGRQRPVGPVPPYVIDHAGRLKEGADCITSMFSLHYMFKDLVTFNGFLNNMNDCLKVGGYFIGCCFDGEKVFDLLRRFPLGGVRSGTLDGTELWSITKQYDAEDLPGPGSDAAFGLPIDVRFISLGEELRREYLVPFRVLEEKMRQIGCELLSAKELQEVGLVESTNTFNVSWEMAKKDGVIYQMSDAEKEFSFLNRWFVFKRKSPAGAAEPAVASPAVKVKAPKIKSIKALPSIVKGAAAALATDKPDAGSSVEAVLEELVEDAAAAPEEVRAETLRESLEEAPVSLARAGEGGPAATKKYKDDDIFLFYQDAGVSKDTLKIKDKSAGRWLALSAPFPIEDVSDKKKYPSVEHYMAAMRYKLATNKPEKAWTLFSEEGSIHQSYIRNRLVLMESEGVVDPKTGVKSLPEARNHELIKEEVAEVKAALRATAMKKAKVVFDEGKWAEVENKVLEDALQYRWLNDARFHKIVEAARNARKMLLYYTPGASSSDLGGAFNKASGTITGENKVGKIIMRLGAWPAL